MEKIFYVIKCEQSSVYGQFTVIWCLQDQNRELEKIEIKSMTPVVMLGYASIEQGDTMDAERKWNFSIQNEVLRMVQMQRLPILKNFGIIWRQIVAISQ